jgi:hypothetical protein
MSEKNKVLGAGILHAGNGNVKEKRTIGETHVARRVLDRDPEKSCNEAALFAASWMPAESTPALTIHPPPYGGFDHGSMMFPPPAWGDAGWFSGGI